MKEIVITMLAAVGVFAVYSWWSKQHYSGQGQADTNANAGNPVAAAATGVMGRGSPLVSGIPSFNTSAYANGHGDQVAAAYHVNRHSTINGSPNYAPAFGPTENRGDLSVW